MDHELARARAAHGFSHGASGIAWALLTAAALTGDERYIAVARGAFDYERTVFLPAPALAGLPRRAGGSRQIRVGSDARVVSRSTRDRARTDRGSRTARRTGRPIGSRRRNSHDVVAGSSPAPVTACVTGVSETSRHSFVRGARSAAPICSSTQRMPAASCSIMSGMACSGVELPLSSKSRDYDGAV